MNEATSADPATRRLTWSEICAQFPDEWVVLVDADWVDDHNFEFGTARVYSHRKHRREASADLGGVLRRLRERRLLLHRAYSRTSSSLQRPVRIPLRSDATTSSSWGYGAPQEKTNDVKPQRAECVLTPCLRSRVSRHS